MGYCVANNLHLEPPRDLQLHINNIAETARQLMEQHSLDSDCQESLLSPVQQMQSGLVLEVEDLDEPRCVWVATVVRNVGGRLLLRYSSPGGDLSSDRTDVWIFCLSPRLHSTGWALQQQPAWEYQPPKAMRASCGQGWREMALQFSSGDAVSRPLNFLEESTREAHSLVVDKHLSAVAPWDPTSVRAARVISLVDEHRFAVRFDPPNETETKCCFAGDADVWDPSTGSPSSLTADELGFSPSMVLEAVNPWNADEICAARIVAVEGPLLRIRLERTGTSCPTEFLAPCCSFDLFPIGWCETNGYPLCGPPGIADERCDEPPKLYETTPETSTPPPPTVAVSYWCPKIYFNYRCCSGPLLSKLRIAALPRSVGPGPIQLVLKEVLSLFIQSGYKPGSVLKQLQGEPGAPLPRGTQWEPLKAKYKQTTYRGSIPIACTAADVPAYCQWVCEKVQCCPCLLGPQLVGHPCPRQCVVTMVKVHWQHKKKAAKLHGRNKRMLEALAKSLPGAASSSAGDVPAIDNNSDDSIEGAESASRTPPPSSSVAHDERGHQENGEPAKPAKNDSLPIVKAETTPATTTTTPTTTEDPFKRKRGRPRKYPLPPPKTTPVSQPAPQEAAAGKRTETSPSPPVVPVAVATPIATPIAEIPGPLPAPAPPPASAVVVPPAAAAPPLASNPLASNPLAWTPNDVFDFLRAGSGLHSSILIERFFGRETDAPSSAAAEFSAPDASLWTADEVYRFLSRKGLKEQASLFRQHVSSIFIRLLLFFLCDLERFPLNCEQTRTVSSIFSALKSYAWLFSPLRRILHWKNCFRLWMLICS